MWMLFLVVSQPVILSSELPVTRVIFARIHCSRLERMLQPEVPSEVALLPFARECPPADRAV